MGGGKNPGKIIDALKGTPPITLADHVEAVLALMTELTDDFLLGNKPFRADWQPNLAWGDYNHLARVAEWLDRPVRK